MVNVSHDALFFVINTFNSFPLFGSLQLLTNTPLSILPAQIFVPTTITIELYTAIRTVTNSRTFDAEINPHDIPIRFKFGFRYFVYFHVHQNRT